MPAVDVSFAKCRSFTRFTARYAKNTSLAGQCYGHTDLAWVPNPIGPGQADSGVVAESNPEINPANPRSYSLLKYYDPPRSSSGFARNTSAASASDLNSHR